MLENVEVLCHSSIRFSKGNTIYFDPFKIETNYNDADVIFITHDHYDHYSEEDIGKIVKEDTVIVIPEDLKTKVLKKGWKEENIITVIPNKSYTVKNIEFQTVPAYNINKQFHPKENNWVGYLVNMEGITYYISGDTDITKENKKVKCDVAFVPVGGTYTMDYKEAAELINEIKPKVAVPTHYGSIIGSKKDGAKFAKLVDADIVVDKVKMERGKWWLQ